MQVPLASTSSHLRCSISLRRMPVKSMHRIAAKPTARCFQADRVSAYAACLTAWARRLVVRPARLRQFQGVRPAWSAGRGLYAWPRLCRPGTGHGPSRAGPGLRVGRRLRPFRPWRGPGRMACRVGAGRKPSSLLVRATAACVPVLRARRVLGDRGAGPFRPAQRQRNGCGLVELVRRRALAQRSGPAGRRPEPPRRTHFTRPSAAVMGQRNGRNGAAGQGGGPWAVRRGSRAVRRAAKDG